MDADKSKAEGKLAKAYAKNGKQYGVIEVQLTLAFKSLEGFQFDQPLMISMQGSLDTAIDGSSTAGKITFTGKMKGKGRGERDGLKFTVDMNYDLSSVEERTAEK